MDDARLKQVANIGSDYFNEMLERIRDIRSSEKRFYQKIRDIRASPQAPAFVSFPRAAWECSQGALRRESWLML